MEGQAGAAKIDWYVTPGLSLVIPDANRKADSSLGFQIGIGMPAKESINLEFTAVSDTLPQGIGSLEFKQQGWLLDGLYFFKNQPKYSAYGIVGAGALQTKFSGEKRYRSTFNAGIGAMSKTFWNDRLSVRTDLRYRIDESNLLKQNRFGDWVVNFALSVPLDRKSAMTSSRSRQDAVKSDKTTAVKDRDGDGISDAHDACQSTPAGEPVDAKGCTQDSDKDGVSDASDACPSTPSGEPVNESGCPRDTDNDGVFDSKDICPDTEFDTPVNETGCPPNVAQDSKASRHEWDSDGDGIADASDACLATPAGVTVNASGCELDQDGDGVVDRLDKCPASKKEEKVDTAGCKIAKVIVLKGVTFDTGSDRLLPASIVTLESVSQTLRRYPDMVVEIAGYSDNSGRKGENKALSKKRADAVARYLIIKGVLAANLITRGYGKENPIASNKTPQGRTLNRRVELHILTE